MEKPFNAHVNADFDYIIIGGGSAGSVLASRLSENPQIKVCLLEAGGKADSVLVRTPGALVAVVRGQPKINNWAFRTTAQRAFNGRKGHQPRGKGLGGSSAINAMLYIRGQKEDYADWESLGCKGWGYDDLLPYFMKSENNENGATDQHGGAGPLQVSNQIYPRSVNGDFIKAGESQGIPFNADFNDGEQQGIGTYQVTQFHSPVTTGKDKGKNKRGERCSAAAAYLHPIMDERKNLTVVTGAHVKRILIKHDAENSNDKNIAYGVIYRVNGQERQLLCNQEVLLCAGAIQSPQVLMLSGIGPASHLMEHGIKPIVNNPNVGANLQDHLDIILSYKAHDTDYFGIAFKNLWQLIKGGFEFWRKGTGVWTTPFAEGAAFFKSSDAVERPDIQLHLMIALAQEHGRKLHWGYGFACHCCLLRPKSRGTIRLASSYYGDAPLIDMNYLDHPDDVDKLLAGLKKTRAIMESEPLKSRIKEELLSAELRTDEELLSHIRAHADTIYHPVGTCAMGVGNKAVVDLTLKVKGVEGLRVIDASIMPTLISGNTNAPVIAIAEKMADQILSGL